MTTDPNTPELAPATGLKGYCGQPSPLVETERQVEQLVDQRNAMDALYANAPGFIATSKGPDHRLSFANASYKRFVAKENLEGRTVTESMPVNRRANGTPYRRAKGTPCQDGGTLM